MPGRRPTISRPPGSTGIRKLNHEGQEQTRRKLGADGTNLPIDGVPPQLCKALARGHAALSAHPGSGKTTHVPLALPARRRAGPLGPGLCYRLSIRAQEAGRPEHRAAEILQANLAPVVVELALWGVRDPFRACLTGPAPCRRLVPCGRPSSAVGLWVPSTGRERSSPAILISAQPGPSWPDLSDDWLRGHLPEWLEPWLLGKQSLAEVGDLNLRAILLSRLHGRLRERLQEQAPEGPRTPGGNSQCLDYPAGPEPVLAVRLQEMFGATETMCRTMMQLAGWQQEAGQVASRSGSYDRHPSEVQRTMKDRRRYPRKQCSQDQVVEIGDLTSGRHLGRLVNVSLDGFLLVGASPIEPESVLQLVLSTKTPDGTKHINVGAVCIWNSEANDPGTYWSGFHMIDVPPESKEFFADLLAPADKS
jgi:hypothetical protein